jgi:hypothetical protein
MRRIAALVLGCGLALTLAAPVKACINDSELLKQEREFKSSYNENAPVGQPAAPDAAPSSEGDGWTGPLAYLGTGAFLLLGGCVVGLRRAERRP